MTATTAVPMSFLHAQWQLAICSGTHQTQGFCRIRTEHWLTGGKSKYQSPITSVTKERAITDGLPFPLKAGERLSLRRYQKWQHTTISSVNVHAGVALDRHQRHNRQQHVEQCDGTRINCKTFGEKILIYYTALIQHSSEGPVEKCNYQDNRCLGVDMNIHLKAGAVPHSSSFRRWKVAASSTKPDFKQEQRHSSASVTQNVRLQQVAFCGSTVGWGFQIREIALKVS